jgi:hypothetical protein
MECPTSSADVAKAGLMEISLSDARSWLSGSESFDVAAAAAARVLAWIVAVLGDMAAYESTVWWITLDDCSSSPSSMLTDSSARLSSDILLTNMSLERFTVSLEIFGVCR